MPWMVGETNMRFGISIAFLSLDCLLHVCPMHLTLAKASSPHLEPTMVLPSIEIKVVRNLASIGRGLVCCLDIITFEHTLYIIGNGSGCVDCHDNMPGRISQSP